MDERFVENIAEEVLRRLSDRPKALCIGTPPEDLSFLPVSAPPYDAVVLAELSPAQLLAMPDDTVCRALLMGKPVFLREEGLEHRRYAATAAKGLYALLMSKERQLRNLGVQSLGKTQSGRLISAQEARRLMAEGRSLPPGARLTPLARDIWEGKA